MAKKFQSFLKKITNNFPQSLKKRNSLETPHFSSAQSRKNYIAKIDLELLEIQIKHAFQELGELTYKEINKKTIKKNSKKSKIIAAITQLKKEIITKKKALKNDF